MWSELERLATNPNLFQLLNHYGQKAVPDREAWQDRLMQLGNAVPKDMVRWHGELLAYGWLEQNSGFVSAAQPGKVAGCYRITQAGLRALRRVRSEKEESEAA